jgi:hypothetical protein
VANYEKGKLNAVKAFVIGGSDEGNFIYIKPRKKGNAKEGVNEPNEIAAVNLEISKILSNEERAKELDREKILKALVDLLSAEDGSFLTSKDYLSGYECQALVFCMAQDYRVKEVIKDLTGKKLDYYDHLDLWNAICEYNDINKLIGITARKFILSTCVNVNQADPQKFGKAAALYAIAFEKSPIAAEQIELFQLTKAEKRQKNVAAKVKALEQKKAELEQERIREENIKSAKKAQAANKKKS